MKRLPRLIAYFLLLLCWVPWANAASGAAIVRGELRHQEKIWQGQRLIFEVTLFTASSFTGPTRFELPEVPGLLFMTNEDRPLLGSKVVEGESLISKQYEIFLFPLRSGPTTVPPISVSFGYRDATGKEVRTRGATQEFSLAVAAIPNLSPGAVAITSSDLEVTDQWQPETKEVRVGDAVERTIKIQARDLPGMALPPLSLPEITGLGIYPGQAEVNTVMERGEFLGQRQQIITYQCEEEGEVVIPAQIIHWWRPDEEKLLKIELPAHPLRVAASPLSAQESGENGGQQNQGAMSPWLATTLIASLILAGVLMGLYISHRKRLAKSTTGRASEKKLFADFQRYAAAGDQAATLATLMRWLDHTGAAGKPASLEKFATLAAKPQLAAQLESLEKELFAQRSEDGAWSGRQLARTVAALRKGQRAGSRGKSAQSHDLPTINPV